MPAKSLAFILIASLFAPLAANSQVSESSCESSVCVYAREQPWKLFSADPLFRSRVQIPLVHSPEDCKKDRTQLAAALVPPGTYFRQTSRGDVDGNSPIEVVIYQVPEQSTNDAAAVYKTHFAKPRYICQDGLASIPSTHVQRVGGLDTGILVVPFKVRKGDLFSDAAIGPYIAYRWYDWSVLASAGLSQISTVQAGTSEIKNETGLTAALGVKFQVKKDWDIAFVVGYDHLPGESGRTWDYRKTAWWSFAIGFNFAK
jgi:hypothetical protein